MQVSFIPGQRVINDAELQLGLGTVLSVDHRTLTVLFMATGDTRMYAKQSAPLTRICFSQGDTIKAHDGSLLNVETVVENNGLVTYLGKDANGRPAELAESQLDNQIQLNRPVDRLLSKQIDKNQWFELRYQTLQHINKLAHSPIRGLTGGRTSLIPHQLYIAHEVANRYAPRVLLADEVGLGKTIEAGMILHHQLLTERARRVLIVVPETLVHQWLVEMLRKFNLCFSLFNEERCASLSSLDGDVAELTADTQPEYENPFYSEQLVLVSLEFLSQHPERVQQALDGDWDLLVVDEAHHLQWSAQHVSYEYQLIERLAQVTRGVLLLTATPEQLGKTGHFARLRLLDPDRFADYEQFVEEEKHYEPIARAVDALLEIAAAGGQLNDEIKSILRGTVNEGDNEQHVMILQDPRSEVDDRHKASLILIDHLLDRHGTGRVLFRNTRNAIKNFPVRQAHLVPLPLPTAYADMLLEFQQTHLEQAQLLLSPELLYQVLATGTQVANVPLWTAIDSRVGWLADMLKQLKPAKVLVIAASADTMLDLADVLRIKHGIHAAVFHEGLSIVERDRAAAYFADPHGGCQVMLASEIGSEGRNFQFAHHLVLFDLPLNPDLLEQRIGRLDRIGQTQTIQIHVPYLKNSAQHIMARWYHEGLCAFEKTCPVGNALFLEMQSTLLNVLHQLDSGLEDLDNIISATQQSYHKMNEILQCGRDRLLEYNSCRPELANHLQQQAEAQDKILGLHEYLEAAFSCYRIDSEPHSHNADIIYPGEHMTLALPGLADDGMVITLDRATALANEDMNFITWEHPLIVQIMESMLSNELGNTALTAIQYKGVAAGTILLECLYSLETASSPVFQASRYLPPTTIRVVADEQGHDHHLLLPPQMIRQYQSKIDRKTAIKIIQASESRLRSLIKTAEQFAQAQSPDIVRLARDHGRQSLNHEINRLKALQLLNPNVRAEEIEYFEHQRDELDKVLASAVLRMDALRVIIVT